MRVAFAVDGENISSHFGHCSEYALVDIEDEKIIRQSRVAAPPHQPGILPPFLKQQGADEVVAGGMGPHAVELFQGLGIRVYLGVSGLLVDAIAARMHGQLAAGESLCHHSGEHHCA